MYNLLRIKEEIELLNKPRQTEILKIFLTDDISTSENKNGVFINLSHINNDIIQKLEDKLTYFKEQDKTLEEMEKIKQDFHDNYFDGNPNTNNSIKQVIKQDKDSTTQYAT
jgi:hypothetical protein